MKLFTLVIVVGYPTYSVAVKLRVLKVEFSNCLVIIIRMIIMCMIEVWMVGMSDYVILIVMINNIIIIKAILYDT